MTYPQPKVYVPADADEDCRGDVIVGAIGAGAVTVVAIGLPFLIAMFW
jgi:hypothetical protein